MEFIFNKLLLISKLNNLNENLVKCESVVNKVKHCNVNEINNNLMKTFKIIIKCDNFDENEDKQRHCYEKFKCFWPKCRYSCDGESNLKKHISHHLNKRRFVCEECNKQFHSNSNLLHHKRYVHSNDRPFVCNQIGCDKTFKTKSKLTQHKLTHSSVKSFGCNKCGKRFTRKSVLISHTFCHSDERQFRCDFKGCDQSFSHKTGLYHHKQRTHIGIKRHKCCYNNCDKSFYTSYELKEHIGYKHSTERPFKCNLHNCNLTFKSSKNLHKHKKVVHLKINK